MRCTSKDETKREDLRRKKARNQVIITITAVVLLTLAMVFLYFVFNRKQAVYHVTDYENKNYITTIEDNELRGTNLCIAADDVALEGFTGIDSLHGEALFDVTDNKVIFSNNMYERLYPASTTKILTAYVTLKYGNLDEIVTVSESAVDLPFDAQICGLKAGDKVKLYDLLCGLLLYSGNDAGNAIAEHISGSVSAFADLMNEEALKLGATDTHFVNPHGLHDEDHYTTVYDLYLIFNECLKYDVFNEIYSNESWTCDVESADGSTVNHTWGATNYFSNGNETIAPGYINNGGKTGTTDEAGSCLVLSSSFNEGKKCISIIMGAETKSELYSEMNSMLEAGVIQLNN